MGKPIKDQPEYRKELVPIRGKFGVFFTIRWKKGVKRKDIVDKKRIKRVLEKVGGIEKLKEIGKKTFKFLNSLPDKLKYEAWENIKDYFYFFSVFTDTYLKNFLLKRYPQLEWWYETDTEEEKYHFFELLARAGIWITYDKEILKLCDGSVAYWLACYGNKNKWVELCPNNICWDKEILKLCNGSVACYLAGYSDKNKWVELCPNDIVYDKEILSLQDGLVFVELLANCPDNKYHEKNPKEFKRLINDKKFIESLGYKTIVKKEIKRLQKYFQLSATGGGSK